MKRSQSVNTGTSQITFPYKVGSLTVTIRTIFAEYDQLIPCKAYVSGDTVTAYK